MIKQELNRSESNHYPPTPSTNSSQSIRSFLKANNLLNKDFESSDNLNEILSNGNEFTLHRLLSDFPGNDFNIDMNELVKFDPSKLFEFPSDTFDQINPSENFSSENQSSEIENFDLPAVASFTELLPPSPKFLHGEVKVEYENVANYIESDCFDELSCPPSTGNSFVSQFDFDPNTLNNLEFVVDPFTSVIDTPSPSPTISKRTATRVPRRTSSRLQSRAKLINFKDILNENLCLSPTVSESSSISSHRTKRNPSVHCVTDIKNDEDLSYYLERRRKNNEASKISRAARKQRFDEMDQQCIEYERVNKELRSKIDTLEVVTSALRTGLIHSFQRKATLNGNY